MNRKLTALAAASFALVACSESGLHQTAPDATFGAEIAVDPPTLDFGIVAADDGAVVLPVTISSVGTADLHVEELGLEGGSFAILTDLTDFILPPGASQAIDIEFLPLGAEDQTGFFKVFSDDGSDPGVEVSLVGFGAVPQLEIDPDPYDFGIDYIGCGNGHDFTLENVGTDDLVVDGIRYDSADGQLAMTDTNQLPITLAPGASTKVTIDFLPVVEGKTGGTLVVTSNDPRGEVTTAQTAEGLYVERVKEEFPVPDEPPVDILFAVDQSCSMDDDVARLASNFSAFITDIGTYTTGWRIGVATLDSGCFNEGILKSTTSNFVSKFGTAVAGTGENYTEALLTVATNALSRTTSTGCNAGFLRSDALLHVILVSDEPEQSASSWSSYVTTMQSYKSDPSLVKISAIAGDYPTGCATADPGTGYYEAVTATGGEFLSICDTNWSSHIEKLATASLSGMYDFELTQTADPSSVQVWVNGTEWTSDWHFDAASNQVRFDVELGGGKVLVKYGVLVECD